MQPDWCGQCNALCMANWRDPNTQLRLTVSLELPLLPRGFATGQNLATATLTAAATLFLPTGNDLMQQTTHEQSQQSHARSHSGVSGVAAAAAGGARDYLACVFQMLCTVVQWLPKVNGRRVQQLQKLKETR